VDTAALHCTALHCTARVGQVCRARLRRRRCCAPRRRAAMRLRALSRRCAACAVPGPVPGPGLVNQFRVPWMCLCCQWTATRVQFHYKIHRISRDPDKDSLRDARGNRGARHPLLVHRTDFCGLRRARRTGVVQELDGRPQQGKRNLVPSRNIEERESQSRRAFWYYG
jgi:hypothetical protein